MPAKKEIIGVTTTVYRLLIYKGDPAWIKHCLDNRGVKDIQKLSKTNYIKEAFLDYVPEVEIITKLTFFPGVDTHA
jgi:hypothetical protein